jgi:hypothetical protein
MTMKKATRLKAAKRTTATKKKADGGMEAMMAAWQKAMTPAEGHKRLEPTVGKFKAKTTFVMQPGDPPQTSDGTSENRWILEGRFVEQLYRGMSMGMPFEGRCYMGFDNVQQKYVGSWMDTFGTGIMHFASTKASAKEIVAVAQAWDPTGKKIVFDTITKIKDKNRHTYEMWTKMKGKRFRTMLVEYTRT